MPTDSQRDVETAGVSYSYFPPVTGRAAARRNIAVRHAANRPNACACHILRGRTKRNRHPLLSPGVTGHDGAAQHLALIVAQRRSPGQAGRLRPVITSSHLEPDQENKATTDADDS